VKALVLAGGYATRLHPVTLEASKPLLKVNGRPIVDYVLDGIETLGDVDTTYVVTNAKFFQDYVEWAKTQQRPFDVVPLSDGTTSNADRLGAIGDIQFAIETQSVDDDLLIVGGDNLFDFSLRPLRELQRAVGRSVLGCYDVGSLDLVSLYSEVHIEKGLVSSFVEKPETPTSPLIGILCYALRRQDVPLVRRYLEEGRGPDKAGHLIQWMRTVTEVAAYVFEGRWIDIGTRAELDKAEKQWSGPA